MYQNKINRKSTSVFLYAVVGLFVALSLLWTIAEDLTTGLVLGMLVTIPSAIVAWFVLSLVLYLRAKKAGSPDLPSLSSRLTVASILLAFLIAVIVVLMVLFAMAIKYM